MDKTADMVDALQTLLDQCSNEARRGIPDHSLIGYYLNQCQRLSDQLGYKLNTRQWLEGGVWKIRCGIPSSLYFFIAWVRAEKGILEIKQS